MSILRLSTVALTIVFFTMGALILPVNTALAHCKGKHLTDPGPDECFEPHGGGDPEPTADFSVDLDFDGITNGGVTVTEVKINGNRQGLNGTISPTLTGLTAPCGITWGTPMAQFSISTAKIPPSSTELTYVEANIYDFEQMTPTGDARVTLIFVPNTVLPFIDRLFPTESNTSNVLAGEEIGVSISPGSCSGTIIQDWTITVTKE